MAPRFIVTRPALTAASWVDALRAHGMDACSMPLIEIVPEPMRGALRQARDHLAEWPVVMFVSGNAVRCFFGAAPDAVSARGAGAATRAWAPGSGTRAALIRAGWPEARIDSPVKTAHQFESESLWAQAASQVQPGTRVLIVRGGDAAGRVAGRNWLAEQIEAAGGAVEQVVAYRRRAPELTAAQRSLLVTACEDNSVWLFSSAEAIAHLSALAPQQRWSRARAIVTHERIGDAACKLGFRVVGEARPALADVIATAEALA
jgi:uroporphyrinogen-III synthase